MFRSFLYIPVTAQRFLDKVHAINADAIILDLEDSIPAEKKAEARTLLSHAVPQVRASGRKVFVRINNLEHMLLDDASAACQAGVDGLVIPKVRSRALLDDIARHLASASGAPADCRPRHLALIEDPVGLMNAFDIASHPEVLAIALGSEDFATSIDATPIPEVLKVPKLMVHFAAKAAGKLSLGLLRSVADYRDIEAMTASIREAAQFGFDGASCIHPSVVDLLNTGFSASSEELARAQRLVAAANEARLKGIGAFTFEGGFVDEPIVQRAMRLLERNQVP